MVFSLYRDEHALDQDLEECLKSVGVELVEVESPAPKQRPSKQARKDEEKEKKEEPIKKLPKTKIGEEQQAIEKATEIHTRSKTKEEKKVSVFKTFTDMCDTSKKKSTFRIDDLCKNLPDLTRDEVMSILNELDRAGKLFLEKDQVRQL
jgi:hypothetical protein